jgi:2-polyprenyl-6-methoxyphenol hydroxylase-like FAD-dependent oxidoreductase
MSSPGREAALHSQPELSADIIVVGAGAAGATAAAVLARQGRRVLLLDERATCPPVFKAEKVLRSELNLLREWGLYEPLLPPSGYIVELLDAYDGRIVRRTPVEQIGLAYSDLVNTLRSNLPKSVETRISRVERIACDGGTAHVHLANGEDLTARLLVLACGICDPLLATLGLRRHIIHKEHGVVLGFNVIPVGSPTFSFDTVTYYPSDPAFQIDYLTLFKFRDVMRANLFTFLPANGSWIREFLEQSGPLLARAFPKLSRVTGEYRIAGKLEVGRADLYRIEGAMPDGVVIIGDAFQTTCPSTGLGIRKAFTDVAVLAQCVPDWFSSPGMGAEKISSFYHHPRKQAMDAYALKNSYYHRHLACDLSLPWRIRRAMVHLKWKLPAPDFLLAAARRLARLRRSSGG